MTRLFTAVLAVRLITSTVAGAAQEVSGEYYDWQKAKKPERPWLRDYSQTLVMKFFLCSRNGSGGVEKVYLTFADALEMIKKVDNLTLGIPKIVYLVGWQFTGHDSGYPSWGVVNESLKRPQDKTATESLQWLMEEAQKYHTAVSLHINMTDAYENSPLWKTYFDNNVVIKDSAGIPIKGESFDGIQSYQLSFAQEWKLGLAQKRIDGLIAMLPQLKVAKTIHLDAFHSIQPVRRWEVLAGKDKYSNPFLKLTVDEHIAAQRKILRYWRQKGIDATIEGADLHEDPFIGLTPFAWGYFYQLPEFKEGNWLGKPKDFDKLPAAMYSGSPMRAEQEIRNDPKNLGVLIQQFFAEVVPWYYDNNLAKKEEGGWIDKRDGDVFLPVLWRPNTLVVYSEKGVAKKVLKLPTSWKGRTSVKLSTITAAGLKEASTVTTKDNTIEVTLEPGHGVVIEHQ